MQVRETYDAGTAVVNITSGTGITLGGTAGTIGLALTATQTAALDGTPNKQYAVSYTHLTLPTKRIV